MGMEIDYKKNDTSKLKDKEEVLRFSFAHLQSIPDQFASELT